jgi:hypothetical protein
MSLFDRPRNPVILHASRLLRIVAEGREPSDYLVNTLSYRAARAAPLTESAVLQQAATARQLIMTTVIIIAACTNACWAAAGESDVAPLTPDESQALNSIQEGNVLSTVAFLASDAMAGRDTPSRELEIASAYVAARFQGAGLEGLGPDGSFYQTNQFQLIRPANSGLKLRIDGAEINSARVLMSPSNDCSVSGDLADAVSPAGKEFTGPVFVDDIALPPRAAGSPAQVLAMWSRRVKPLASQGATAVLVRVNEDSVLPEVINGLATKPVALRAGFGFPIPVILVRDTVEQGTAVEMTVPSAVEVSVPVHNVIGVLRGSDAELTAEAIIITAHLDHIGTTSRGSDPINNGADDNATGVTGVLTLADAFAALEQSPKRSVIFMTFWGEEKGLLGSKYYSQHPLWPLEKTVANINLEMIGRPAAGAEGKAWGTGWTRSTLGPQLAVGAQRAGVEIFHNEQLSEMLYTRSDNFPLANVGVIAHSFSAGSLHDDYHQPSDEVAKLNIPHMTKIIRGLFAGTLPLANGDLTPTAN